MNIRQAQSQRGRPLVGDPRIPECTTEKGTINRKEAWREVGAPVINGVANVVTDEERVDPQARFHLWVCMRGRANGENLDNLHIFQFISARDKPVEQFLWNGTVARKEDAMPRFDDFYSFLNRGKA